MCTDAIRAQLEHGACNYINFIKGLRVKNSKQRPRRLATTRVKRELREFMLTTFAVR